MTSELKSRTVVQRKQFSSLSLLDLLEARDLYHVHLTKSARVQATAIGLYRIRKTDPDFEQYVDPSLIKPVKHEPRRLDNTVVRPWSWPCVLVFVPEWKQISSLSPDEIEPIPKFLYMPDGRVVPVCVVELPGNAPLQASKGPRPLRNSLVGGGYPLYRVSQGIPRFGTLGCLVTSGESIFALTSQHVSGNPGEEVSAMVANRLQRIGRTAELQLKKLDFETLYPGFRGAYTKVNVHAGLVKLDSLQTTTASILDIGKMGRMKEFSHLTASLDWVGRKVCGVGAASGMSEGEIQALFYRYQTVGGIEYVSDFLIGGRDGTNVVSQHGDSGTIWCLDLREKIEDKDNQYRPFAVQWGGQHFAAEISNQFVLASSLSIICREMDIEIVTDFNKAPNEYWGEVGHYKIAQEALKYLQGSLKTFFDENASAISFSADEIEDKRFEYREFVPLTDVPDEAWKHKPHREEENWSHYADIDLEDPNGKTLDDICGDPPKLVLKDWIDFYKRARDAKGHRVNKGSLPFRVWQIYNLMLQYRSEGKAKEFLAASGILAHYLGDTCQPLHGSQHADGLFGSHTGVHSAYETDMINANILSIRKSLEKYDFSNFEALPKISSGHDAGAACISLMRRARTYLDPAFICKVYDRDSNALWRNCGTQTVRCMADGIRTLAHIWQCAYDSVEGQEFSGQVEKGELRSLYRDDPTFLESIHLHKLNPGDYKI